MSYRHLNPLGLFHETLKTSFKQVHVYEVMDVQKTKSEFHAFIKTTTSELIKKILAKHVIVHNEVLYAREVFDTKGSKSIVD